MKQMNKQMTLLVAVLLLASLACGIGGQDIPRPNITIPPEAAATAAAAAQQAGAAAATAAAVAGEQGGAALATVQAGNPPDLNSLKEKLSSVLPDESGNVSVTINDSDLNRAIQGAEGQAGSASQSTLQNPEVRFTGGYIVLSGDVTQPINGRLTVNFRPYVVNGALQFEVVSATLGSVNVPPAILTSAASTLNNTLGEAMNNLPASVQLKDIIMGEGTMTVIAGR